MTKQIEKIKECNFFGGEAKTGTDQDYDEKNCKVS
jgi:hypothetical protein